MSSLVIRAAQRRSPSCQSVVVPFPIPLISSRRGSSPTLDNFTYLTATLSTTNMNPNNKMEGATADDNDDNDWRTASELGQVPRDGRHGLGWNGSDKSSNVGPRPWHDNMTVTMLDDRCAV
jgi:hypothetical protein